MQRASPEHDALERFAAELRELRLRAGKPSYRDLSERTHFGRTTLSEALNGSRVPTWEVTRALVAALGGDESQWRDRWAAVAVATAAPGSSLVSPSETGSVVRPEKRLRVQDEKVGAPRRSLRLGVAFGALAVAVGASLAIVLALSTEDGPPDADTRPGKRTDSSQVCMIVTARDITVFVSARDDQNWSVWRTGTHFWAHPADGARGRLRTPMLNGRDGWVTGNEDYVRLSDGCP